MIENPIISIVAIVAVVYLVFYILKDRKRAKKDLSDFAELYFTPLDFLLGRKNLKEVKSKFSKGFSSIKHPILLLLWLFIVAFFILFIL